jgi:NAD(P)H-dependent FMN reductase
MSERVTLCGLLGSLRARSNTARVLDLCLKGAMEAGGTAVLFDARTRPPPLCDGSAPAGGTGEVAALIRAAAAADALVFASPSYNGTISALAKTFIEHLGPDRLTGKVVGCIGVSAEGSAAQAAGDLCRILVHCGAWVVPIMVEVPFVERVLAAPELPASRLALARAEALGRELVATVRVHRRARHG